MKTLDEAIQHALEVAIAKEEEAYEGELQLDSTDIMGCRKCATEHRQLAGWLTELKKYRELKHIVADWKSAIRCRNADYYTGYMSALSVVEGMIAEVGNESNISKAKS